MTETQQALWVAHEGRKNALQGLGELPLQIVAGVDGQVVLHGKDGILGLLVVGNACAKSGGEGDIERVMSTR